MNSKLPFHKIQGCGNDFVICNLSDLPADFLNNQSSIMKICDRHYGVGSDGLLVIGDKVGNAIEVLMFNPDGSKMGMCGNGIRCVVRALNLNSKEPLPNNYVFSVFGRKIECFSSDAGLSVEVNMGVPSFEPTDLPMIFDRPFLGEYLNLQQKEFQGWALSMGNPHFVTYVEKLEEDFVREFGPLLESHSSFPERANIGFVEVVNNNLIKLMVWERGAGFTLACGTGACAAVVAGIKRGVLTSPSKVMLPGGELEINWDFNQNDANVFLKGPAKEVFNGTFVLT